ncbi:unnamed protein product [Periconia digitata]|uniref:FHA domain-containing protein n=1 Tax=Periconia digitata TaxID=1303443 RepID=A0A9W4XSF3_9PLEO|nr:unnamed protein product [Periconia digitata]
MAHETRTRELSPWSARRALTEQMNGPQRNPPPPPKEDQNAAPWKKDMPGRPPRNSSPVRNAGNVSTSKSPPPRRRTEAVRENEEKERTRPGSRKSEQSGVKSPLGSRDRELSPEPYRKPQDSRADERRRHRSKDRHGDKSTHRRRDSSREGRHERSRERRRHRSSERGSEKLDGSRRDRSTSRTDHHGRSRGDKRDRSPIRSERRDRSRDHSRDRSRDRRRNRSRDRKKESESGRTHDRKRDRSRDDHKQRRRDRSRSRSRDRRRHHSPDRDTDRRRRNRSPSSSSSRSPSPPPKRHKPMRSPSPRRRAKAPLPSQELSFRGTDNSSLPPTKYGGAPPTMEKPNFKPTGLLAKAANKVEGTKISLKYHEPPEARKPPKSAAWRLFVFKGEAVVDTIELHARSCWLLGRAHQVVDYLLEHPSSSAQHAVIQFRYILKTTEDEFGVKTQRGKVKPYVIDLESSNGTELNGKKLDPAKYFELRDKDILTFAGSEREYIVVLPPPDEVKEGV